MRDAARTIVLAVAALLAAPAHGQSCGTIPVVTDGTGPAFAGTTLTIDHTVKVDDGTSDFLAKGTTTGNQVVPAAGGSPTAVSASLPPLSPAVFPPVSGSYAVPARGSGALAAPPYALDSVSVGDGGTLTLAPGEYFIGSLSVGRNATIRVSPAGSARLSTRSDTSFGDGSSVNAAPDTGSAAGLAVFVYGARTVTLGKNTAFTGAIYAPDPGSAVVLEENVTLVGGVVTGGALTIGKNVDFDYTAAVQGQLAALTTCPTSAATLNHLRIEHPSGGGLTCTPSTLTVRACQNAACTTPYTGGVSGTLGSTGGAVLWPSGPSFSIPAGSSSTTVPMQLTSVGSTLLSASATAPAASGATQCNFGAPACSFTAADAGFVFDVPDHVAEAVQTVSVSAVKKSDSSLACAPALSGSRSLTFRCAHANPASGTLAVRVGGFALNASNSAGAACDAGGRSVSLTFNASGVASTSVQYADVGQIALTATYTGSPATEDSGLTMTGADSFVAAPASFSFEGVGAPPLRAGVAFSASVTARNSAGAATPNFGRESAPEGVTIGFVRRAPTGTGASNGSFTGSLGAFTGGTASSANLTWSEVGRIDLTATLASASYLGTGLSAAGSTGAGGAVGPFIPHHFDVAVTPACSGAFSYAGQPFTATVTARNGLAAAGTTLNYDGSAATAPNHAKTVTLVDAPALGVGSWNANVIAPDAFTAGVATARPAYTYTAKLTAPQTLTVRATDTDAVTSAGASEGSTPLRSGRLRLVNAFGSATSPLAVPVLAEYWSGNAWLLNSADACTAVPAASVAVSNARNHQGNPVAVTTLASAIAVAGGQASLTLGPPSPATSGVTFDLALNLGSTGTDQSCHAAHPPGAGAAQAWLRSFNGACAPTADRDPAARASFGIYSPETRKTVHVRELY